MNTTLFKFKPANSNNDKGSVLAELTLVLPLLTFLVLAVTDFGMFLQSYFQITHIAREGLRAAVSTPDLSGAATNYAKYVATTDTPGIITYLPATGLTSEHKFIHDRMLMLIKAGNGTTATHTLQLQNNAVEISTKCTPNLGVAGADTVEVRVTAEYRPITPFNDMLAISGFTPLSFNFSTKSTGAYLFNNCAP
jgi:Flp pilus assembly protein TadG